MAKTPKAPAKRPPAKKGPAHTATNAKPAISANTAWSIGAVVVAAGAGLAAFLTRGRIAGALAKASGTAEGHVPTDLLDPHRNADDRAVADFRPDMDAVMTAAEREALRPPVGKPSMTASNGSMNAMTAPAN